MQEEFFTNDNELTSYELLRKAIDSGHVPSMYAYGIMKLFSTDQLIRENGASDLSSVNSLDLALDFVHRMRGVGITLGGKIKYKSFHIGKHRDGTPPMMGLTPELMLAQFRLYEADLAMDLIFGDTIEWV